MNLSLRPPPLLAAITIKYTTLGRLQPLIYHTQPRTNTTTTKRMSSTATFPPTPLQQAAQEVTTLLQQRKETVSVAETAAGGLISAAILATPGASRIYRGGLTLYTLESRIAFAGWTDEHVRTYDGPTPQIVEGLADNVRAKLGSTYTVSESGTAGPTASGKTPNRQPGYVALAVSGGPQGTVSRDTTTDCGADRQANMVAFAIEALRLLKEVVLSAETDAKI